MQKINEVCAVVVTIVVVTGFFGVMAMWFMGRTPTGTEFGMLVGALVGAFTQVVAYWLGSSAGSKAKDATIAAVAAPPGPTP